MRETFIELLRCTIKAHQERRLREMKAKEPDFHLFVESADLWPGYKSRVKIDELIEKNMLII